MIAAFLALMLAQETWANTPLQTLNLRFTSQQTTADFDILQHALISGEPGVYRYIGRSQLEAEFRAVRGRLDRSMDAVEFYREIAPAVAAIESGHTHLDWPEGLRERLLAGEPLLPLGVRVLHDDRAYVFRDFSSARHELAGAELLSVNGRSATSLVSAISATLSEDGDIPTSRRIDSSGLNFVESLPLFLGVKSPFSITVLKGGRRETIALAGLREKDLIGKWKQLYADDFEVRKGSGADFRLVAGASIGVMRISHWDYPDDPAEMNLTKKFADWFGRMKASRTKTLIIDIRHNGGGEETLGTLLFSYLAGKPFLYYEATLANGTAFDFLKYVEGNEIKDALPRYVAARKNGTGGEGSLPGHPHARYELVHRPNLGLQQPSSPHFAGRVFVLIDGQSFSTSSEFAAIVHSWGGATFIGEETSGAYYGNDSGITPTVVLPNTKFRIDVPLIAYYTAVNGHRYPKRGVLPDCPVANSIEDDLAGRDNAMRAALQLAAGSHAVRCTRVDY